MTNVKEARSENATSWRRHSSGACGSGSGSAAPSDCSSGSSCDLDQHGGFKCQESCEHIAQDMSTLCGTIIKHLFVYFFIMSCHLLATKLLPR